MPSTTSLTWPTRPIGCSFARFAKASGGFSGVWMTPSETAFARMPRDAYSIASDFVAATRPPLLRVASSAGESACACSTMLVEMFTTCPPRPALSISPITRWLTTKKPVRLTLTTFW